MKQILAKIKKLLLLAQSSNEHEAALAAARAQELIDFHKLSLAEIDAKLFEAENPVDICELSEDLDIGRYRLTWRSWKARLLREVARLNGCRLLWGCLSKREGKLVWLPRRVMMIVGRESDRQVVEYLATYLMREIERLAKIAFEKVHGTGNCRELPNWTTSFGFGAAKTVLERMMHERTQSTTTHPQMQAVVLRDDLAVAEYLRAHFPLPVSNQHVRSGASLKREALNQGHKAGGEIQWHTAVRNAKSGRLLEAGQ
jgi:hypothetical protein